jgi:hypothetical protein
MPSRLLVIRVARGCRGDFEMTCGAGMKQFQKGPMSRRPRGKLTKQIHDPAESDVRKPGQPRVPKFKAGKKRDPAARPPKK